MPITMPSSSRMKRQHRNVVTAGMRSISENDGAVYNKFFLVKKEHKKDYKNYRKDYRKDKKIIRSCDEKRRVN